MAADVGYELGYHKNNDQQYHQSIKLLEVKEYNPHHPSETTVPVTRDLLGGSFSQPSSIDNSPKLNIDFKVPFGWQKHLDLKSGQVFLQQCSSQTSRPTATKQCLDSTKIKRPLDIVEDTNLDLRLTSFSSSTYQSVCTLDAVKFALDRAKHHERLKMMFFPANGSSKSPSTSSMSTKASLESQETLNKTVNPETQLPQGKLSAAGCPNCLLYVMISEDNPKCPKCYSTVSLPAMKKSGIDLDLRI